jgi:hypothetical protein
LNFEIAEKRNGEHHKNDEENYIKAAEMKVSKSLYGMFAQRLQRIVDGKPAFEETRPAVLKRDNGTIYG